MAELLKPCPFCGWKVDGVDVHDLQGVTVYRVRCKNLCAISPKTIWSKNKESVIECWNTRSGDGAYYETVR